MSFRFYLLLLFLRFVYSLDSTRLSFHKTRKLSLVDEAGPGRSIEEISIGNVSIRTAVNDTSRKETSSSADEKLQSVLKKVVNSSMEDMVQKLTTSLQEFISGLKASPKKVRQFQNLLQPQTPKPTTEFVTSPREESNEIQPKEEELSEATIWNMIFEQLLEEKNKSAQPNFTVEETVSGSNETINDITLMEENNSTQIPETPRLTTAILTNEIIKHKSTYEFSSENANRTAQKQVRDVDEVLEASTTAEPTDKIQTNGSFREVQSEIEETPNEQPNTNNKTLQSVLKEREKAISVEARGTDVGSNHEYLSILNPNNNFQASFATYEQQTPHFASTTQSTPLLRILTLSSVIKNAPDTTNTPTDPIQTSTTQKRSTVTQRVTSTTQRITSTTERTTASSSLKSTTMKTSSTRKQGKTINETDFPTTTKSTRKPFTPFKLSNVGITRIFGATTTPYPESTTTTILLSSTERDHINSTRAITIDSSTTRSTTTLTTRKKASDWFKEELNYETTTAATPVFSWFGGEQYLVTGAPEELEPMSSRKGNGKKSGKWTPLFLQTVLIGGVAGFFILVFSIFGISLACHRSRKKKVFSEEAQQTRFMPPIRGPIPTGLPRITDPPVVSLSSEVSASRRPFYYESTRSDLSLVGTDRHMETFFATESTLHSGSDSHSSPQLNQDTAVLY